MIPKFRSWLKTENKMYNVESIDFKEERLSIPHYIPLDFDEVEFMQSTGVFDKNGIEIFEGDVVKTTRFKGRCDEVGGWHEEEYKGIVKQLEGCWMIDTGNDAVYLWSETEENEIIGHKFIHEFEGVFE